MLGNSQWTLHTYYAKKTSTRSFRSQPCNLPWLISSKIKHIMHGKCHIECSKGQGIHSVDARNRMQWSWRKEKRLIQHSVWPRMGTKILSYHILTANRNIWWLTLIRAAQGYRSEVWGAHKGWEHCVANNEKHGVALFIHHQFAPRSYE